MRRYGPPGLSTADRVDMWCRWKAGYHVREIARAFARNHGSRRHCAERSHPRMRALTLKEREDISRGIASAESGRSIADRLGRAASTVSREMLTELVH
jgi:IS30 family transposase